MRWQLQNLIISNVIPDNNGIVEGEEAGQQLLLLRNTVMRLQLQAHLIISNVIPDNGGIVEGEEAGKLLLLLRDSDCHEIATADLPDHQQCDP